jgi:hypothetical protein
MASRWQLGQRGGELVGLVDRAHALAAAAGAGLDQHRIADARGLGCSSGRVLVGAVVARHQRHAGGSISAWLRPSGPWRRMALAGGPMKTRPASSTGLCKVLVLAQEAVARVHGLRAGGRAAAAMMRSPRR